MGLYILVISVGLMACGQGGPSTSEPADPTVEFDVEPPEEPQMLVGFFKTGKLSYPAALGSLAIGVPEAEASAELDRIRDPRMQDPRIQEIKEYRIIGASLKDWDVVGISVIVDTKTEVVDQIDLSMPSGQALSALTEAFGPWVKTTSDAKERKVYVWVDADTGLQLELFEAADDRSICKYRKSTE